MNHPSAGIGQAGPQSPTLDCIRLILSPIFAMMKNRKNPPRMSPATRIPYSKPIGMTQRAVIWNKQ